MELTPKSPDDLPESTGVGAVVMNSLNIQSENHENTEVVLRNPNFQQVAETLAPILDLDDDDEFREKAAQFIHDRIEQLSNHEPRKIDGDTKDFIAKQDRVDSGEGGITVGKLRDFILDDETMYNDLLDTVRGYYKNWKDGKNGLLNAILCGVDAAQSKYFNLRYTSDPLKELLPKLQGNIMIQLSDDPDDVEPDSSPVSIRSLRDCAVCAQRASVLHNYYTLLGFDSTLTFGQLEGANAGEKHVWVRVSMNDSKDIILDPMNPISFQPYRPAMKVVAKSQDNVFIERNDGSSMNYIHS